MSVCVSLCSSGAHCTSLCWLVLLLLPLWGPDPLGSIPGLTLALWIMEFENSARRKFLFDRLKSGLETGGSVESSCQENGWITMVAPSGKQPACLAHQT